MRRLLLPAVALAAGTPRAAAAGSRPGGRIATLARVGDCGDGCRLLDFHDAAVIAPWLEAREGPVTARAAVDLRLHGPTAIGSLADAGDPALVQPWSLRVRDAWLARRGERLDLRLGAARVAWGVADGLSIADNVNPYDLEDPTRFDGRLAVPLASLLLHAGPWSLQGVVAPFFVPAAMPAEDVGFTASAGEVFDAGAAGDADIEVGELDTRITLPDALPATLAVRLRWVPAWGDLAASWVHGYDSIPQVDGELVITGFSADNSRVDVGIPIAWPRVDVGALEARGGLGADVTGWGEVALVLPEATAATTSERQLEALVRLGTLDAVPDPLPRTVTQDGRPYVRWNLGLGRPFGPVDLGVQWLHGFPTERQAADLHDYAIASARWSLTPTLRLRGAGAAGWPAEQGWLASADLEWLQADALTLRLGATAAGGPEDGALGALAAVDQVRAGASMRF